MARRLIRNSLRRLAALLVITSAVSMFIIAAGIVRLLAGPIDVPVRAALIERAISRVAPGWGLTTEQAQIEMLATDGLSGLVLREVVLRDPAGNIAARAPKLALKFSLSPSTSLEDSLSVREVGLAGAAVDVIRDTDGAFHLGVRGADPVSDGESGGDDLTELLQKTNPAILPKLRIADAKVTYVDLASETKLIAESGSLTLEPDETGIAVRIDGVFLRQDARRTTVSLDARRDSGTGEIAATLGFEGLIPHDIAGLDENLTAMADVRVPLSGSADLAIASDGTVSSIDALVTGAPGGTVKLGEDLRSVERFAADLAYDAIAGELLIESLDFAAAGIEGSVGGSITRLPEAASQWRADLTLPRLLIKDAVRGLEAGSGRIAVAFDLDMAADTAVIERLEATSLQLASTRDAMSLFIAQMEGAGRLDIGDFGIAFDSLRGRDVQIGQRDGINAKFALFEGGVDLPAGSTKLRLTGASVSGIEFSGLDTPVDLRAAQLDGSYDTDARILEIARLGLDRFDASLAPRNAGADPTERVSFSRAELSGRADLASHRIEAQQVVISDLAVGLPDLFDRVLHAPKMTASLSARSDDSGIKLRISDARTRIEDLPASFQGDFTLGDGNRVSGTLVTELGPTVFEHVPGFWPRGVAPGGFRWVSKNVRAGTIHRLGIDAAFDTANPDADRMVLDFDFSDAVVAISGGLPPIEAGRGRGVATLKTFALDLESGTVRPPQADPFNLGPSRLEIPTFKPRIPVANIDLKAVGPVRSMLRYLDQEPLGFITPSGFEIDKASASAEARVKLRLPLANDLDVADVDFEADGRLTQFSFFEANTGVPISGDVMKLRVLPGGLEFEADARVDGLAARLRYRQGFEKPSEGEPESTLTLQSYLTREDFKRRGVDVDEYFNGVAVVDAKVDLFPGGGARFEADTDLTGAALKLDLIGWGKGDGSAVNARLKGFRNPDGQGRVEQILVEGTSIEAAGALNFDETGTVRQADFSVLRLGDRFDAALRYIRGSDGGARIELDGRLADLRKPFSEATDARSGRQELSKPGDGPTTEVALNLAVARLRDDLLVDGLRGGLRLRGERTMAARIEGRMNRAAPFLLLAERRDSGLALRVTAEDAGAFLGSTSVFSGAYGGKLQLDMRTRDDVLPSEVAGTVRIDGATIRNSETMREILSGGAIGSLLNQMTANGLTLDKVRLPFRGVGGRWHIDDGIAHGPAIGLTMRGNYDIAQKTVDLNGTISPAYAINGALGSVPLLGALLTGGEGEGVFGVTFAVRGNTADPQVWVNPLSALAPGFLRKIVSGVMDGEPEGSSRSRAVRELERASQK